MLKEKNVKLQKYLHIYVNIKQFDGTYHCFSIYAYI